MEEENICPKCGEGILRKPQRAYGVFEGRKHPDFVCDHCGAFHWRYLRKTIPPVVFKSVEGKEEQKPRGPKWFGEFLKQEEKKKEKRWGRNSRRT
jgi:hypothetical protein